MAGGQEDRIVDVALDLLKEQEEKASQSARPNGACSLISF